MLGSVGGIGPENREVPNYRFTMLLLLSLTKWFFSFKFQSSMTIFHYKEY